MMLTRKMNIAEEVWGVCGTVSSILSGLETRSLGQLIRDNVVSSLATVCPSLLYVNHFLGLTSTKQGLKVTCYNCFDKHYSMAGE